MAARSISVGLAAAVFFFVVLFASPAQCRRGQVGVAVRRYPRENATTTTSAAVNNATALDDGGSSKIKLIFCVLRSCNNRDCYCCEPREYCYYSRKKCQANCVTCDPTCPPTLHQ